MAMLKLTEQEFQSLSKFVHQRYGIDLSKKRVLIEGRMSNMLADHGFTTFQQYMDMLFADKSGNEMTKMLNKLTTNYTYFKRENDHFEFLVQRVLPMMEQTHASTRVLRIWSAGCSSGQEPYTMAMYLHDYFGNRKQQWDTSLLATDISERVLEKARAGIYTLEEIKDVPQEWLHKYFVDLHDGRYQVCDMIRKDVIFRTLNLMEPFHFKKQFDLIFCRNVMIYFDAPTKETLVQKYYDWTAEGGFLFIGHSEALNRNATRYHYVQPAIYQKRSKA